MAKRPKDQITAPHKRAQRLSPQQLVALELFAIGKRDSEAAQAAGVTRETVNRWRNHEAPFQAELNKRRVELWATVQDRLRGLATGALDVLETALTSLDVESAVPVAVHVLKAVGLYGEVSAPTGDIDPESILRCAAEARAYEVFEHSGERRPTALDELVALTDPAEVWNKRRLNELTEQELLKLRAGADADQ